MTHEIEIGDVVQIDPAHDDVFGGCFMVVTKLLQSWNGLQGYVDAPGEDGHYYYRVPAANVKRIGKACWGEAKDFQEEASK